MLQKVFVVLIGLMMSLLSSLTPAGLFAAPPAGLDEIRPAGLLAEQTLATIREGDGTAFAPSSILWAEVDGRRVTDDAWGTGEIRELRFKVGTKEPGLTQLAVGDRILDLRPGDEIAVRMFRGDFAFRHAGLPGMTLQLQGDVKTTLLNEGTGRTVRTEQTGGLPLGERRAAGAVSYIVLGTGERVDTVSVDAGGKRLHTEEATTARAAKGAPGNLLAKWVKIDGTPIREYTWGAGEIGRIEFEPAEGDAKTVVVAYDGAPTEASVGSRVLVREFVGEYVVYQVAGGLLRLRLDGYAQDMSIGAGAPSILQGGAGAPLPGFEFTPENPRTSDTVQFVDQSIDHDGVIVLRRWNFGDNATSVEEHPRHRFTKPGIYPVTLNTTDDDLKWSEVTRFITVKNTPPIPEFDFAPKSVTTGTMVSFTDRSFDGDGLIASHSWDFGDGHQSTQRHPQYSFSRGGNVTVTLTVTDDLGGRASLSKVILVRNAPPLAAFSYAPHDPLTHVPVQFVDESSDRDGTIVDWQWDFGDGNKGIGPTRSNTYTKPGVYQVSLTVTDDQGDAHTATKQIFVRNRPPFVDFTWSPNGAPAYEHVLFRSLSGDSDGEIVLYEWDFDDPQKALERPDAPPPGESPGDDKAGSAVDGLGSTNRKPNTRTLGPTVTHQYTRAGDYQVSLTVTDSTGSTASVTKQVSINHTAPRAAISVTPNPAYRNINVSFADVSTDVDGDRIVSREWDFGDGSPRSTEQAPLHRYTQRGEYVVRLNVTDAFGHNGSTSMKLSVVNRPPIPVMTIGPANPVAGEPIFFQASVRDDGGASQAPYRFEWRIGEESDSRANFSKVFPTAGIHRVFLRAIDATGAPSNFISETIEVGLALPQLAVNATPTVPRVGQEVTFRANASSLNGRIVDYTWDFRDGSSPISGADRASVAHTFARAGIFPVSVTVTDDQAMSTTKILDLRVNTPPTVLISYTPDQSQMTINQRVDLSDDSRDADGDALVRRLWTMPDGTTRDVANPSFQLARSGANRFQLEIEDVHGAVSTGSVTIQVLNAPPTAAFEYNPAPPRAGENISFQSLANDVDGTIVSHFWQFGDGKTSTEANPRHTYDHSGTYQVSYRVSDGQAFSQTYVHQVRVLAAHDVLVIVDAVAPDGKHLDIIGTPDLQLSLRIGAQVISKSQLLRGPEGNTTIYTIASSAWAQGDQVTALLHDTRYQTLATQMQRGERLQDGVHQVLLTFEMPMPLVPTIAPVPGVRASPLLQLSSEERTSDGAVIYRDPSERFRGTGTVHFIDGRATPGALVSIQARFLGIKAGRGVADPTQNTVNDVIGWCKGDTAITNDVGHFTWDFDETDCVLPSDLNTHLLGRWEVRVEFATLSFASPRPSTPAGIVVDPIGLLTLMGAPP